jgi:hypothetical protein
MQKEDGTESVSEAVQVSGGELMTYFDSSDSLGAI